MRKLLCAALLCAASIAHADLVAKQGDDWVSVFPGKCENAAVLELIAPPMRDEYHPAKAKFGGQDYAPCWRRVGDQLHLVYEDGDQGLIPVTDFKQDFGA
jgi:hypothetical protein